MPTYQYECEGCDQTFEIFQSMMDAKLTQCPECKQEKLHRLIGTGGGIIFKGSGFYETDYKKKDAPKSSESSASSAPGEEPKKIETSKPEPAKESA